ncbi:hypothetical protein CDZ98_22410 [Mameliella alba]|nr:hypothetical protein CDZ98_22410 [Mameliella alba]
MFQFKMAPIHQRQRAQCLNCFSDQPPVAQIMMVAHALSDVSAIGTVLGDLDSWHIVATKA